MTESQEFLQFLGKNIGLNNLEFDNQNTCTLTFDDIIVVIEYMEEKKMFYLSSIITSLPDDNDKMAVYEFLLYQNSFHKGTNGGAYGIERALNAITYTTIYHLDNMHEDNLEYFVELTGKHVDAVEAMDKALKELKMNQASQNNSSETNSDFNMLNQGIRI